MVSHPAGEQKTCDVQQERMSPRAAASAPPRKPNSSACRSWNLTVNKASEDGISMTFTRSLWTICSFWGVCSGRFSSPKREHRHARNQHVNIEHSRRLRGTGLRPEDSPGGHFVSYVLGTVRRKLSASVANGVRVSGQWNGKVSERYAHLRIWGSQVVRVTVDRTKVTVPVRDC